MAANLSPRDVETRQPSESQVRACLDLLLGGKEFTASDRNRRFLTYIVDETLAGRAERIKAYSIALAAFDRTEDFDPLTDPIVRIEASRLRRALEHYYLTAGRDNPIRIDIPKGSYVPTFDFRPDVAQNESAPNGEATTVLPTVVPTRRPRWILRVPALAVLAVALVLVAAYAVWHNGQRAASPGQADVLPIEVRQFENAGDPGLAFIVRGFNYDLVTRLIGDRDFAVYGGDLGPTAGRINDVPSTNSARYTLLGSVRVDTDRIQVTAILADSRTRQLVKAWNFEGDIRATGDAATRAEIAEQLVRAIRAYCAPSAAAHP